MMRLLFNIVCIAYTATVLARATRRFGINNDRFVEIDEDGVQNPYQIIAAEVHYARILPAYWRDRLERIKALGINTIQTYVPWNWHCPQPDVCGWTGSRDIEQFIRLAHHLDLKVLLRPGPYICAEWDFGGLPWWLGKRELRANMTLRSADATFLEQVESFWSQLLPRMVPLLYQQGGPIIAVQIENELGYFGQDMGVDEVHTYLHALHSMACTYLGHHVILYTADPPQGLRVGSLPDDSVLSALNFWATTEQELQAHFALQATMNTPGKSPRFVAEFYVGNIAHWQESQPLTSPSTIHTMTTMLLTHANASVSVSFYMIAGGTSWGFYAGANVWWPKYRAHTTSYDFEAPISEGGTYGQPGMPPGVLQGSKYHLMREAIMHATGITPPPVVPAPVVYDYGQTRALRWLPLLDVLDVLVSTPVYSDLPMALEDCGQGSGVAVYTTSIPTSLLQQGAQLYVGTAVRDFATIYLNNTTRVARVDRTTAHDALVLPLPMVGEEEEDGGHDGEEDQHTQQKQQQHAQHKQQQHVPMHVVVEAMGHNTFFDHKYPNNAFDLKGLLTPLALNGIPLQAWITYPLHLEEGLPPLPWDTRGKPIPDTPLSTHPASTITQQQEEGGGGQQQQPQAPAFVQFEFWVDPARKGLYGDPPDTYLALHGWGKGVAFVNNFNLGWYWPEQGPQMTLYVPGPLLSPGINTVTLLELVRPANGLTVSFMVQPDFITSPHATPNTALCDHTPSHPTVPYPAMHRTVWQPTQGAEAADA